MSFHCQPSGVELLGRARDTLKTLLKDLPEARRYDALMIVNALGIVMREADADSIADAPFRDALAAVMGYGGESDAGKGASQSLHRLEAELAMRIRRGQLIEGDAAVALRKYLYDRTASRLRVSNPRYLATMTRDTGHK